MPSEQANLVADGEAFASIPVNDQRVTSRDTRDSFLAFFERLEHNHPELADARLAAEVNDLLNRKQIPSAASHRERFTLPSDEDQPDASDFRWYQQIVVALPPLENERTAASAKAVEVGLFARERLQRLDESRTTRTDLAALYTLIERGEAEYQRLILSNLRLVFHWSKGVARSIDRDWAQDAFQAGCIGLMRGLQGWDYMLGYKLSTFVSWHIRQAIQRWRANEVNMIRIPVHVWEIVSFHPDELSPVLESAVKRALDLTSLEEVIGSRDEPTWDGGLDAVEDQLDRGRLTAKLLRDLPSRQADVLRLRYGLTEHAEEPMTLDATGQVFSVTRERIRQIEEKALKSLRATAKLLCLEGTT